MAGCWVTRGALINAAASCAINGSKSYGQAITQDNKRQMATACNAQAPSFHTAFIQQLTLDTCIPQLREMPLAAHSAAFYCISIAIMVPEGGQTCASALSTHTINKDLDSQGFAVLPHFLQPHEVDMLLQVRAMLLQRCRLLVAIKLKCPIGAHFPIGIHFPAHMAPLAVSHLLAGM